MVNNTPVVIVFENSYKRTSIQESTLTDVQKDILFIYLSIILKQSVVRVRDITVIPNTMGSYESTNTL